MLRRFNVKNFMSFSCTENGTSEEFSMIPGKVRSMKNHLYDDGNNKLLKFAGIYGANAAGKSNLIKAISCMKKILMTNSTVEYSNKYSRIGAGNEKKPSYFEMEIILNSKRYSYGFEVVLSQSRFISEWLIELVSDDEENIIFERDIENHKDRINEKWSEKELNLRLHIYLEDSGKSLFLHTINQQKETFYEKFLQVSILQEVYQWFNNQLYVNEPSRSIAGLPYFFDHNISEKALKLINIFGTGICECEQIEIPIEDMIKKVPKDATFLLRRELEKIQLKYEQSKKFNPTCLTFRIQNELYIISIPKIEEDMICNIIKFKHSDNNLFDFGEESDGTQRLWDLLEILLTEKNSTFIIDEIDRCLHPSLTYKFVKTFFELTEKKNVQLIVTTHESRLLDFDLLRRDEIWFVDKRESGESDIYSLEEYNERFDKKIDKAYLEGRYGGVPVFTSLFPIEEEGE